MAIIHHIALIPDGSRRWAVREGIDLRSAYRRTCNLIADCIEGLFSAEVQVITIYLMSVENLRRSSEEIEAALIEEERLLNEIIPDLSARNNARVKIAGLPELLPAPWNNLGRQFNSSIPVATRKLNFCLAYSPMLELAAALESSTTEQIQLGGPEELIHRLWVNDPVDLLIRSGGARTLSNFIPLQCGYAQLLFLDVLFNDLSVKDILKIVSEHKNLALKYGW